MNFTELLQQTAGLEGICTTQSVGKLLDEQKDLSTLPTEEILSRLLFANKLYSSLCCRMTDLTRKEPLPTPEEHLSLSILREKLTPYMYSLVLEVASRTGIDSTQVKEIDEGIHKYITF